MRSRLITILLATVVLAATPLLAATGTFDKTLSVNGSVDLEVVTGSGHITVKPGSSSQVQIHGVIHASSYSGWFNGGSNLSPEEKIRRIQQNPPIEQNGNVIRIGRIDDQDLKRNIGIDYELVVPAATRLASKTGSGDQTVDGIQGPAEASTGSGNVHVSNIAGEVRAQTGSGDVRANDLKSDVRLSTGSGGIEGRNIGGTLNASTGSGDIRIEQVGGATLRLSTGSGSIELRSVKGVLTAGTGSGDVRVDGEPTGDWRVSTGSGTVTLNLPSQLGYDLYAHTTSGNVHVDAPITMESGANLNSRHEVRGRVRGGGPHLDLRTGSGDINVK